MIVVVNNGDLDTALSMLEDLGETAWHIGEIRRGEGPVEFL